jgi:beta-mannanase
MAVRGGMIGVAVTGVVTMGAGFALAGTAAQAATGTGTVSVLSTDDAYTSSTRKAVNFGTADKLVVGRESGETRQSYVKFAPSVAANAKVTGAELRLPLDSKPDGSTLALYAVPTTWTQKAITAANAPATGALVGTAKPKTTDTTVSFDLSKMVKSSGVYAFTLKSSASNAVTRLRSKEYGTGGTGGPELRLTVTRTAPAPTTTAPTTTAPVTTPPATTAPAGCTTGALLVPTCGVLWGAAAGGFSDTPRDQALKDWEAKTGRTAAIYHTYHMGSQVFPTKPEIAMTQDPAKPRVLLTNWKVIAGDDTWAGVAAGRQNERIHAAAARFKAYGKPMFLVIHHEPENDVKEKNDALTGTYADGMTAKDYKAMYRHVVQTLRADGATNVITVMAYMGNEKWMGRSWWKDLYPGDDVVDWIGLDSYVSVDDTYHRGDMGDILDRKPTGGGLGWYDWATTTHPGKPIMVAEWGMYHRVVKSYAGTTPKNKDGATVSTDKTSAFASVIPELKAHPKVKAMVYFDTKSDDTGDRDISVDSTPENLAAFTRIAADPIFNVTLK